MCAGSGSQVECVSCELLCDSMFCRGAAACATLPPRRDVEKGHIKIGVQGLNLRSRGLIASNLQEWASRSASFRFCVRSWTYIYPMANGGPIHDMLKLKMHTIWLNHSSQAVTGCIPLGTCSARHRKTWIRQIRKPSRDFTPGPVQAGRARCGAGGNLALGFSFCSQGSGGPYVVFGFCGAQLSDFLRVSDAQDAKKAAKPTAKTKRRKGAPLRPHSFQPEDFWLGDSISFRLVNRKCD